MMAEHRLRGLRLRFQRDPDFERKYRAAMQTNFDEGYAVRVPAAECDPADDRPAYYLPHFGVRKGVDAVRIVFDAAAKFRGWSLNDAILPGPALQTCLPAILIRFRDGAVAWASEIKAMYSRIRLREEDRRYHRFLWVEEDGSESTCQMTRMTFGVNCSPYVAIRTTWRAAEDAGAAGSDVLDFIKQSVYVDDVLGSARSTEEAGERSEQEDEHEKHPLTTESAERVLGVSWITSRDVLGFRVTQPEEETITRVGLTSHVARLFDPQGTAATLIVKARLRLRLLGLRNVGWSDPLEGEERGWWRQWFRNLEQLKAVEFSRCLFPAESLILRRELHTFVDASEEAYAAVVYVRSSYRDGRIVVRHVKAATKLAPTRTLSGPKLELNAALLGARLGRFVTSALTRGMDARFFWTDSSTVRNWIRAAASGYHVFVSTRIGEIQTLTQPDEWRFVPGRENPADAATRGVLESEAIPFSWFDGPAFLYQGADCWPSDLPWMTEKTEMRTVRTSINIAEPSTDEWADVAIRPGDIPCLVRRQGAFMDLLRKCQAEVYGEEIRRIRAGRALKPNSRLLGLTPQLDADGLLRLGGRIGQAQLPYDARHLVILPGHHPLATKIVTAFHHRLLHAGTDYVLSHVRQHFWITSGRETVKKIQRSCAHCLKERAKPALQLMGDLPASRLAAGATPFSRLACDYFGPFETSPGRNRITKRWGALFTCLVTRAVYLDLAHSLSADDFLLVFRRHIGLYGKPVVVHSDNGTAFVGAERELREAVQQLNQMETLANFCTTQAIEWRFQPACTPHFGGAHEAQPPTEARPMEDRTSRCSLPGC